jgi:hypothetical protein
MTHCGDRAWVISPTEILPQSWERPIYTIDDFTCQLIPGELWRDSRALALVLSFGIGCRISVGFFLDRYYTRCFEHDTA